MRINKVTIGKEEFTEKILSGERDFSGIILKQGSGGNFNVYHLYPALLQYLKQQDLQANPIILDDSVFAWTRAQGLYLPYVKARNAKFVHCKIGGSNFSHGDFTGTTFRYSRLENVNFDQADLTNTNFFGVTNTILQGHGLSRKGRPLRIENWQQTQFEKQMQLGAYCSRRRR